ncbi:MAG: tRNA-dihydrouridine synthase [Solirubrobacterales bacterium]|nr:tRNA-dihydrouridine synthase [Solirubrobacterales bacterium]MCB8970715.1 tRNA-dihydrouridine synthase [Thermoleophilales bacterium]MCO5328320.1 tRNA-dihydrouridine synthase [Solirubrobacterales bacterium]
MSATELQAAQSESVGSGPGVAHRDRPALTEPFSIGDVEIPNRVLLAPLAGIGNWFVRLQAKRHGAGMAFSEMVSSHAIHYRNERTLTQLLAIHPDEHPVALQLFGSDPEIMREAAGRVAEAGADIVDLNMGCPVKKVRKTGAGAELLADPDLAVAVARAAVEGCDRPVTVKLRSGLVSGDRSGVGVAVRLVEEAGVSAVAFHPRSANIGHKGFPDYGLVRELVGLVDVPVIVSGGLSDAEHARFAYEESGADAVMIARGSFGNPWIFEELVGTEPEVPPRGVVRDELLWVVDRAEEHFGAERAARYLRKFYPWYLPRLGLSARDVQGLDRIDDLSLVRERIASL